MMASITVPFPCSSGGWKKMTMTSIADEVLTSHFIPLNLKNNICFHSTEKLKPPTDESSSSWSDHSLTPLGIPEVIPSSMWAIIAHEDQG